MKFQFLAYALAACTIGVLPANVLAGSATAKRVFERVSSSVVEVRALDAQGQQIAAGSGVVIGREEVASNCHIFAGGAMSATVIVGEQSLSADLVRGDKDRDICVFRAGPLPVRAAKLGSAKRLSVGDPVFAVGAPLGLTKSLSSGLVSGLRVLDEHGAPVVQFTAPISAGSSGGGLFDEKGRLVGITTLTTTEGQQLNFAAPVEWLDDLNAVRPKAVSSAEDLGAPVAPPAVKEKDAAKMQQGRVEVDLDQQSVREQVEALDKRLAAEVSEHHLILDMMGADFTRIRESAPPAVWVDQIERSYRAHLAEYREVERWIRALQEDRWFATKTERFSAGWLDVLKGAPPGARLARVRDFYLTLPEFDAGTRWVSFGFSVDGMRITFDSETIRTADGWTTAWLRYESRGPETSPVWRMAQLSRIQFSCDASTMRLYEVIDFDAQGAVASSRGDPKSAVEHAILPGSIMEGLASALCSEEARDEGLMPQGRR